MLTMNENLAALVKLLRAQGEWEAEFHWDFGTFLAKNCETKGCAIGLAAQKLPGFPSISYDKYTSAFSADNAKYYMPTDADAIAIAEFFEIELTDYYRIFTMTPYYPAGRITPIKVANLIEDFFAANCDWDQVFVRPN